MLMDKAVLARIVTVGVMLFAIAWKTRAVWVRHVRRRKTADAYFAQFDLAARGYTRKLMEVDENGVPMIALHPSRAIILVFPGPARSPPREIGLANIKSLAVEQWEIVKDSYSDFRLKIGVETGEPIILGRPMALAVRVRLERLLPGLKVNFVDSIDRM